MKGITLSFCMLVVGLLVVFSPAAALAACDENLPAPAAELVGFTLRADADGNQLLTYELSVTNWNSYPAELFENATDLPACDSGTHNARTWVGIYNDEDDSLLQNICDLASPEGLDELLLDCVPGEAPMGVYVTLTDRLCGITYTSEVIHLPPQ